MTTAGWTSNTGLAQIAEWLASGERILVLTHTKPDGDAVGSTLAVARALRHQRASREVCVWYSGPLPTWLNDVARPGETRGFGDITPRDVQPFDRILILDTGSWPQLDYAGDALRARRSDTAFIDHHRHGDPDISPRRFVDPSCAAACQPAADLVKVLLKLDSPMKIPRDVAEPLYLGLATDTGWFRHSNVTPAVMYLASLLLHTGVDAARLYTNVEQRDRAARPMLLGRALASLRFLAGGKAAVALLRQRDFDECNGEQADIHGFHDPILAVDGLQVAAVLSEADGPPNPLTKASFRSKAAGPKTIDVNALAQRFGGGGHIQAAGARLRTDPDSALAQISKAIEEAMERAG